MARSDLTPVFKALADPTRRRMLDLLERRPRTTGDLCEHFDVSRFAVMKHLAVLEAAGLVLVRREGRERWNHLNAVPLQRMYERWMNPYQAHRAGSLLALSRTAERPKGEPVMPATPKSPVAAGTIVIEQEVEIAAPPARVFEALTTDLAAWWGAPYLVKPEAATAIVLEARPGGRLYETWGDAGGAVWAIVTAVKRDERLELTGPIGMSGAVVGVAVFDLARQGAGARLRLSHRVLGEVNEELRASYHGGWGDLLGTRLKGFVETGARSGLAR